MSDSPPNFFADLEWDNSFDREVVAQRIGGGEFNTSDLVRLLGLKPGSVWPLVARGTIEKPARYEASERNRSRAVWSAEQVAGMMLARRLA